MALNNANSGPGILNTVWRRLGQSGTASQEAAQLMQIGLEPFLSAFEARHFGEAGFAQGTKLVLGKNGEGKTHLLYCLRELALRNGHVVAMLDPKTASVGDSPFAFAQQVVRSLETAETSENSDGELRLMALLRASVDRKRDATLAAGQRPEVILPRWAEAMRGKDLHPWGLGDALAKGLSAANDSDTPALREAAAELAFENKKFSKKDAEKEGSRLLQSIPQLVQLLGFRPLVILLDEAETAVEQKGHAKRLEFLKFLRFLNDHVAGNSAEGAQALIVVGCTDELWPQKFLEYTALYSRLADPGRDSVQERIGLTPRALAQMNKVWVQETFRGDMSDYEALGGALLELAVRVHPDVDLEVQRGNIRVFAGVASTDRVRKQVKRMFVKAFCSTVEAQVEDEAQRQVSESEVNAIFATAGRAILEHDEAL